MFISPIQTDYFILHHGFCKLNTKWKYVFNLFWNKTIKGECVVQVLAAWIRLNSVFVFLQSYVLIKEEIKKVLKESGKKRLSINYT